MALMMRNRREPPRPRYRMATLTWTADRVGQARMDDTQEVVQVTIPNGLWCRAGERVALVRYPGEWVAARRMVFTARLSFR
jgi:hypothetical protein